MNYDMLSSLNINIEGTTVKTIKVFYTNTVIYHYTVVCCQEGTKK